MNPMETNTADAVNGTDCIEGPIAEFDRYDRPTGAFYFRCVGCGIEAMRRRDVLEACRC